MKHIGFIGAGNMAGALIKGLLEAKLYAAEDMAVSDALPAQLRKVKRQYGVEGMRDNTRLVQTAQTVVLSVKPQILDQILAEIRPVVTKKQLFISIAAGFPWPAWKAVSGTAPGSFGSCPIPRPCWQKAWRW